MISSTISRISIIGALLIATVSCQPSSDRPAAAKNSVEVNCKTVDQDAAELIVRRESLRTAADLLDQAIAKCPPDARRHHQRAMAAAALGDPVAEAANMDRAITIAEELGDKCLLDLMLLEREALRERRSISELPISCRQRPTTK